MRLTAGRGDLRQGYAPGLGYRARGAGNGGVEHHDGDGRATDAVDRDVAGPRFPANLESIEHTAADVLVYVVGEILLGDANQQNRFLMGDDPHTFDYSCYVKAYEHTQRFSRVGRDADHVVAQEHVAEEFLSAKHRRRRGWAVSIRDAIGIGEIRQAEILQILRKRLRLRGSAHQVYQQRDSGHEPEDVPFSRRERARARWHGSPTGEGTCGGWRNFQVWRTGRALIRVNFPSRAGGKLGTFHPCCHSDHERQH